MGYLEIENLTKSYGEGSHKIDVLKGLNCTIEQGEICVLLGPSGSGKSTFLNIVGGLEDADSPSQVRVDGRDICQMQQRDLAQYRRRELGFVFQFYNLVPDLTVRENIEVGAHIAQSPLDVKQLIAQLGLETEARKFPRQISGGQQQRCSIGRALVKNPHLLLCDEPTGALDYDTSLEILELMQRINAQYNTTIIIVTHNTEISRMANRILRLHGGTLAQDSKNAHPVPASQLVW